MITFPNLRTKYLFWASLFFAAIVLTITILIAFFNEDSDAKISYNDLISSTGSTLATIALGYASYRSSIRSSRLSQGWKLITLAMFSFAVGDIIWVILEVGLHQSPFPSTADFFYVAFYPLFLTGVIMMPARQLTYQNMFKMILDMTVVMLAAVLAFWNFIMGPLAIAGQGSPLVTQILSLAYPVGDLLLLTALVVILFHPREAEYRTPITLLSVGIIFMVITDCLFSYQTLAGVYIGGGLLDVGWLFAYSFIGMAGVWQGILAQTVQGLDKRTSPSSDVYQYINRINYLPYIALAGAFLLLVWSYNHELPMDFFAVAWGVGILITMILVRQIMTLIENNRLYSQLQHLMIQAQSQAEKINKANLELQLEIAERKRIEEQLAFDALHDALTKLPNRALLIDRLTRAIQYSERHHRYIFSLLFMDLDQFKVINDSMGHSVGDQLLIQVSKRLSMNLRENDTVARLGGDEFVVLIEENKEGRNAVHIAQRILDDFKKPFYLANQQVYVTVSIGIVNCRDEYHQPEDMLRDADIAMYHAKMNGKARFEVFYPFLREQAMARMGVENSLRK